MITISKLLLALLPFVALGAALTFLARAREIPALSYWSIPLAAALPWILAFVVVLVGSTFVKPERGGEGALFAAMFPMAGSLVFFVLGAIVGFFVGPSVSQAARIFCSFALSAVPAMACTGYFVLTFIRHNQSLQA